VAQAPRVRVFLYIVARLIGARMVVVELHGLRVGS